jgi:hypothetical protein
MVVALFLDRFPAIIAWVIDFLFKLSTSRACGIIRGVNTMTVPA